MSLNLFHDSQVTMGEEDLVVENGAVEAVVVGTTKRQIRLILELALFLILLSMGQTKTGCLFIFNLFDVSVN